MKCHDRLKINIDVHKKIQNWKKNTFYSQKNIFDFSEMQRSAVIFAIKNVSSIL